MKKILVLLLLLSLFNCKKEDDETTETIEETTATIITKKAYSIHGTSAYSGGSITGVDESLVIRKGICWSTGETPTINDAKKEGEGFGIISNYNLSFGPLEKNTTYYARAYAYIESIDNVVYGNVISFKTTLGGFIFKTQAQVDEFVTNNTEVTGVIDAVFLGNVNTLSDISDISGLSAILHGSIQGDIGIYKTNLTNLNGLENITGTINSIYIHFNYKLENIDALQGITECTSIKLLANYKLTNIDGLSGIKNISHFISFSHNSSLSNLDGFENLEKVGLGYDTIQNVISINENELLTNIDGLFRNMSYVNGDIAINNSYSLTEVNATSLQEDFIIAGDLTFGFGCNIKTINGFNNLSEVHSLHIIGDNAKVNGFNNISTINGYLNFQNLTEITGFNKLVEVKASLNLHTVNDFTGLSSLTKIDGDFSINNTLVYNIDVLSSLSSIGGILYIGNNSNLQNINGLTGVNQIKSLNIYNNDLIENIDGLSSITSISDDINIEENASLSDFCGLDQLIRVEGYNGGYNINRNAYNPSLQNMIDGNCSQ